ncbi:Single-stranded DNA-binding protein [Croceitalea dokdonensis DOKDO 023]|uniref:Single-stranded DNA-binding protein n=1 Tax=Croceitalea dokdonensis DOKDO 023 TaxID=1300341 RepID=A0A0P7B1E6_9FLAO|nr:single-stranded DNA-binding protein [Croceitalea dokdonensis]KPM32871.1 Single-stranded DNA-binding protein [Croceitalea dokdonensis DOKDO 023]
MSGTVNKVILIGHLGDEVKMHYFEGGGCIGRFPIATNETYTNKQTGEKVSNTDWHNVVVRNKAAEICEKYLSKGDKIYVEGRLKNRQWQGEDGNMRYTTEVQVQDFTFLTNKNEPGGGMSTQGNTSQKTAPQQTATPAAQEPSNPIGEEDDLPF